jgi:uncharacterized protein (UPF0276 family)
VQRAVVVAAAAGVDAVGVVVGVAAVAEPKHRVGIGWRPELAAGIFAHLDRIDVVEVLADNYFKAPRRELDALRALAEQVPVQLHGVGLGLASAYAVDTARLDRIARLIERVRPTGWSEHLAFVRAAGVEIGHLAMPPRTAHTVEQTVRNVESARAITGSAPALENIATLFDPPMSTYTEAEWSRKILDAARAPMLLDLHNLYANAVNAGRDPLSDLATFPLERVRCVHLSGGMWISHDGGERRLLDDHVHSPPEAVFELLRALQMQTTASFDVILERDGHYPAFEVMLEELDRARAALKQMPAQPVRRYA